MLLLPNIPPRLQEPFLVLSVSCSISLAKLRVFYTFSPSDIKTAPFKYSSATFVTNQLAFGEQWERAVGKSGEKEISNHLWVSPCLVSWGILKRHSLVKAACILRRLPGETNRHITQRMSLVPSGVTHTRGGETIRGCSNGRELSGKPGICHQNIKAGQETCYPLKSELKKKKRHFHQGPKPISKMWIQIRKKRAFTVTSAD